MNIRHFFLLVMLCLAAVVLTAAGLKLPVKKIAGESYYYYKVGGNETVDGIAKKIGVSAQDIIKFNPSAAQGVTKKQLLFFPVEAYKADVSTASQNVAVAPEVVKHIVKKSETLYGIAKLYDVSVDDLVAANPSSNSGVGEGDVLIIPQAGTHAGDAGIVYHTIQPGESMYSVSKQFNTTIETLLELNPGIYPNNFIVGDVIKIKPNSSHKIELKKNIKQFYTYTVKAGDTYRSLSTAYKVPVDELMAANPGQKRLKKGKVIYIPCKGTEIARVNSSKATVQELEQTYASKMGQVYKNVHKLKSDGDINIAIVLPFQLQKSERPRQADLYVDFYKGFLLAVDSLGNRVGKKVNVDVLDTQHNLNVTDSLLALDKMKNMDILIAPGEPKQLQRCNEFGKKHGVTIVNCFSPKNDDYTDNPRVLQVNSPTTYMTAAVNDWIDAKFKDYNVIFLDDPTNTEDKDIYTNIKEHITDSRKHCQVVSVVNMLDYATLSNYLDPGSSYLFIPTSGSKSFLAKIAPAVKQVKLKRFDCEVSMLGFPQYFNYLKEYKSTFQAIDTYLFSRFFIANENRARRIENQFIRKFGSKMISTTPCMGLMGFDLGAYLLTSLGKGDELNSNTPAYDGIQMDIDLKRVSNWGGLVNRCVELVHLYGTSMTESIIK